MTSTPTLRQRLLRVRSAAFGPLVRGSQEHRRSQFAALSCPSQRVVFLGDSITEQGLWDEWFPGLPVLNRGIGGETSVAVRDRLHTAVNDPRAVFLLVGTNDLSVGLTEDETLGAIGEILDAIRLRAPGRPVFVQSVMPRTARLRSQLTSMNRRIRRLCSGTEVAQYVDLWPALGTPEGALREDFSVDRLHLNGDGYRAWVDAIRPLVERAAAV